MMNYLLIKQQVDIVEACDRYGIKLNRSHKACCPFHKEKTASFSVNKHKQIFKCFGCGAGGDVITLIQKLFNTTPLDAAKILNQDFHLGLETERPNIKFKQDTKLKEQFKQWENKAFIELCNYRCELWFASKDIKNPLFSEALQNLEKIDYFLECLEENSLEFYKVNKKVVSEVERRRIKRRGVCSV